MPRYVDTTRIRRGDGKIRMGTAHGSGIKRLRWHQEDGRFTATGDSWTAVVEPAGTGYRAVLEFGDGRLLTSSTQDASPAGVTSCKRWAYKRLVTNSPPGLRRPPLVELDSDTAHGTHVPRRSS